MNSHQQVNVKPMRVRWSLRRNKKLKTPTDESRNERRMRADPIDHFLLELISSQTWETMRSSRPKMATTTAKDTILLARVMPMFIPPTLAILRLVTHFRVLLFPMVQKCHNPKSFPLVNSQWPSHTAMEDRTIAIATQRIIRLLINVSKKDFLGLLRESSHWALKRSPPQKGKKLLNMASVFQSKVQVNHRHQTDNLFIKQCG